jgi:hypothetical protein
MKKSQIVLVVSLLLFIISFTQTAVYTQGNEMFALLIIVITIYYKKKKKIPFEITSKSLFLKS